MGSDVGEAVNAVEILMVEDNPHDAELTLRALKKHNIVHHLHWVKDGSEALDFIFARGAYASRNIKNSLKVVFLDLKLPKVDGLEVLREMKLHDQTKNIPVVVLTSSKEEKDLLKSYELGVNSYVVKPVEFDSFAKEVGEVGTYWLMINKSL